MTDTFVPVHFSLKELAEMLIRQQGIHDGLYDLSVEFQVAVGAVGPSPSVVLPGAMIGVSGLGLMQVSVPSQNTIDAAKVNPMPKKASARKKLAEPA
jgi:hypothetical protein